MTSTPTSPAVPGVQPPARQPSSTPRASTRRAALGLALGATLLTTACGLPDRVVGLHAAPTETVSGAPFGEATAQEITSATLTEADRLLAGEATDKQLKAVLTGPALRLAQVAPRFRGDDPVALETVSAPTILAISAGRDWPRTILATTQRDSIQRVHVLTSASPTAQFKLWLTADLLPGASVPALPPLGDGTTLVGKDHGLVAAPAQVFTLYGQLLNAPTKKTASAVVSARDAFANAIKASSAQQTKALGKLGTLTRANAPIADSILAFRLADGSALAFGQLTRTDTIKPTSKAKRLDLPKDLATLAKRKSVTEALRLTTIETLIAVIPVEKKATVIGAAEQLAGLSAK